VTRATTQDRLETYAGQIRVLTLANQQLRQDNHKLRDQIQRAVRGVCRRGT
jgi:hypothetical protein